jgi:putative ABC transport system substrate-binding protein
VIHRRAFLGTLGLLAAPLAAEAQPAGKVPRIGYLHPSGEREGTQPFGFLAFLDGMRRLGHVSGTTFVLEERWTYGQPGRVREFAADLVRQHVDVIVAGDTANALAAKEATATIPVIFAGLSDPIGDGVVSNLAKPSGNVTGISMAHGDQFSAKWLELIRETDPGARRVAVLWNQSAPPNAPTLQEMEPAARTLGLQLMPIEVHEPSQLDAAFRMMTAGQAGALVVLPSGFANGQRQRIVDLAAQARLPTINAFKQHAVAGDLMSYGPSLAGQFERAAAYVDKILKGAKPANLPVEQPTTFELAQPRLAGKTRPSPPSACDQGSREMSTPAGR